MKEDETNSWQGIFLLHSSAYNYILTNGIWCTCMEQFAMNHILNKLQTTCRQLNPRLSCILSLPWETSKQICVLYFHPEAKSKMSHMYPWLQHLCISSVPPFAQARQDIMLKLLVNLLKINVALRDISYLYLTQPQCQWSIPTTFSKVYNQTNESSKKTSSYLDSGKTKKFYSVLVCCDNDYVLPKAVWLPAAHWI